jgi:hypothetical protein
MGIFCHKVGGLSSAGPVALTALIVWKYMKMLMVQGEALLKQMDHNPLSTE